MTRKPWLINCCSLELCHRLRVSRIYATQTSFPCYFGAASKNNIFTKNIDSQVTSYAGVLKSAGYTNLFLTSAKIDYAGTGRMMKNLGYDIKGCNDFNVEIVKTNWGCHDLDLFNQAKLDYSKLQATGKPFNLTLLTIDTHFPGGMPDKRLREKVSAKVSEDDIAFCYASLDYLLQDFINFVKSQDNKSNTEIIILGDHLLMGNSNDTPAIKKLEKKARKIVLLSTRESSRFALNDEIRYYNMPSFVLDIAGVESNAVFSNELFDDMSIKKVSQNRSLFTQLNFKLLK